MSLNPQQEEAVLHTEGPLLILAGAGSGKTRVIVHRITHLLQDRKIAPENILAVTFTNKAAGAMKERLQSVVPTARDHLWISTFHSSCVRMLRSNCERIGLSRDFVIYDDRDQKTLLKECIAELKLNDKTFHPNSVLARIQTAKNHLMTPERCAEDAAHYYDKRVAELYSLYQQRLRQHQALDFGDLLMEAVLLLQNHASVRQYYQQRFQYIMIDEYQDTNMAQYNWVRILAEQVIE